MHLLFQFSIQAQGYQADFEEERKDRETAHSKIVDMESRYGHLLEAMKNDLHTKSRELDVSIIIIIVADLYQQCPRACKCMYMFGPTANYSKLYL